ncbi:DUF7147 family protein [Bacillus alkalicellulosilyticus]|uniref:DUF7147 family protein n=1 Tax=Alkalihalobacterium alkalicellulosilyticum TaxID=1912214 RepID=UPI00099816CB|nr:methylthioribose kinase [Bacillus alkalicellulosilyticus]
MIQRFIELGEGYSDLYELIAIAQTNRDRVYRFIRIDTVVQHQQMTSFIVVLTPATPGKLMPLYICREGIPQPEWKPNQRYTLFENMVQSFDIPLMKIEVKSSDTFEEKELYYQYLIGVLRMNHFIPPLQ